jgi:hypothetical protein
MKDVLNDVFHPATDQSRKSNSRIDLWQDEKHHLEHLSFWNIRFWQYDKNIDMSWEPKPVHCGLAPRIVYHQGIYAPHLLLHYGLIKEENRHQKAERYKKHDPGAKYFSRSNYDLIEKDIKPQEFKEEEWQEKVEQEVQNYIKKPRKKANMSNTPVKHFLIRRKKDGFIFDVPENKIQEHLREGFELVDPEGIIKEEEEKPISREDLVSREELEPKTDPTTSTEQEEETSIKQMTKDELIIALRDKGVTVDRRKGAERLRKELADL